MSLIPVEEALARLLQGIDPVAVESVALASAGERILAEDVHATRTQPPFSASAMDGYAVVSSDTMSPDKPLTVIGEVAAGSSYQGTMQPGQALRIFTGAPVPDGATAILIQENARREGDQLFAHEPTREGQFIRPAGLDFKQGDALLTAGTKLDFRALSLAGAMNHAALPVRRRPLVAILANGDELVEPGETPGPNQIIASNQVGIAELVRRCGGQPLMLGIAPDDSADIGSRVARAIKEKADVLVTLGGASVGDHDLIQSTLGSAGMDLQFWRIAMRPGKPLMAGSIGPMRVLGLPGNPVSSLVCGLLFLKPLIEALLAQTAPAHKAEQTLPLGAPLKPNDMRQDYLRARIEVDNHGNKKLVANERQDSSMLSLLSASDALIVRPPHAPAAEIGEQVPYLLF
ncbi:molybdopterin molybdotransferase MoeA [Pseudovibrio exalbescens]|uniref:molybdopterin molybdotransferase MoeA n=1 Tax=Pseudovibrio exalbescens TaxID=197461 RepID=UPI00236599A3|nr:gephyrin-like molybdotransferase Glp [Pseudovibrio exalbescens]MDD7908593.1 molybdopterin molybdotransferase MoeA [Pseudovibrio exalbescens]